jgi:hypothetical protein
LSSNIPNSKTLSPLVKTAISSYQMASFSISPVVAPFSGAPQSCQFTQLSPILQLVPVQSPHAVVPPSQPLRQVDSVISQLPKSPTIFPLVSQEAQTTRTYACFNGDPGVKHESPSWTLSLSIDIPSNFINPTLTSLVYFIKYATMHDNGNSTVQTDVVLSTMPRAQDQAMSRVVYNPTDLGIYRSSQSGYTSRMVDEDLALSLSTVPAVKCNGGNGQWSHYVDAQRLFPDVRIIDASSMYLNFHIDEYPTAQTSRCLDIQVSASWVEDLKARKAKDEEERKARERAEEERKAILQRAELEQRIARQKAEEERIVRENAEKERIAREKAEEERIAREKAEEEKKARERAEEERKAREKPALPTVEHAPAVADHHMQLVIEEAAKAHGAACSNGFAWKKTKWGYQCEGGGHKLTFEQLGIKK